MDLRQRTVGDVMRSEVVTLAPGETLDLGQDIMRLGRVRHMPVVEDDGTLVGIVSNRDLLEASLSKAIAVEPTSRRAFLRSVHVSDVMAKDVVTIASDVTLAEAARLLVQKQIGCLPVVSSDGKLLGLVTETDLLTAAFLGEEEAEAASKQRGTDVTATSSFSEWVQAEVDELRRVRDELSVQAHLAKAELRDTWDDLEAGFKDLERRAKRFAQATEEPLQQLETDARNLVRDLRNGYRRIRDAI